ncbi:MAG: hypothetical protein NC321_10340 [Clostridium sp.]|nr:hypothetical protein [Clostridium sp.]
MRKLKCGLAVCLCFLLLFSHASVCLAGDIPETLLQKDYPVYFGEVKSVDDERITIIQRQPIKGNYMQDREISYDSFIFTDSPVVGDIYLCAYINENNPLYLWEVDCYDTSILTIANTDNMSKRMEQYLNDGLFDEWKNMENMKACAIQASLIGFVFFYQFFITA